MKKIIFLIISIILFFYLNACAGYKPIYSSSNFNFIIENHSIKGEEKLANSIYRNLYNISLSNKDILRIIKTNPPINKLIVQRNIDTNI